MRQRLESLIDKYEKKMKLNVSEYTLKYYQGKIEGFTVALNLLTEEGN